MSKPPSPTATISPRVVGVDACKKGWIGITNDLSGYFGHDIDQLISAVLDEGPLDVVAIDIPIGLPSSGPRQADLLARKLVGKRASSVFPTPVRAALMAASHAEASAVNVASSGKGLSQQAYGLGTKILQVDEWVPRAPCRVIEVHPEVSFAVMKGVPLNYAKSSWAGMEERRRLLRIAGIGEPSDIGIAGQKAAPDDVLDATAAAWSALRFTSGSAISYPSPPEDFGNEHEAAIWA